MSLEQNLLNFQLVVNNVKTDLQDKFKQIQTELLMVYQTQQQIVNSMSISLIYNMEENDFVENTIIDSISQKKKKKDK